MKVAIVAPFSLYPKGTVFSRLLPMGVSIAGKGHEVQLVVPQDELLKGSFVVNNGKFDIVSVPVSVPISVPMGPLSGGLEHMRLSSALLKKALSFAPDVLHVSKPKGHSGLVAMLHRFRNLPKAPGATDSVPLVVDADDYEGFGGMNSVMNYPFVWKYAFQFQERTIPFMASKVTLASNALADYYSSFGVKRDDMLHLPNGVNPFVHTPEEIPEKLYETIMSRSDSPYFSPSGPFAGTGVGSSLVDRLEMLDPETTISLFTRFRDHDVYRVDKIFRRVQKCKPNAHFIIVGKGEMGEDEKMRVLLKKHLKKDSFTFTGTILPGDINKIFSYSNIFMVPMDENNITRSKCSAKLVDAMALGKAVVADAVGENGTYITSDRTGILVTPVVSSPACPSPTGPGKDQNVDANVREFSNSLISLLEDPSRALELGGNARKHILKNFSWSSLSSPLLELYKDLL